jgi:hypothetical protein
MRNEQRTEELRDRYRHSGFYPSRAVEVARWDDGARVLRLTRRSKKLYVAAVELSIEDGTIGGDVECETLHVETRGSSLSWTCVE